MNGNLGGFAVGDRVAYTPKGQAYRTRGLEGTITRVEPTGTQGWFVLWDGERSAIVWTRSENLTLARPAGPEEYESWFVQ